MSKIKLCCFTVNTTHAIIISNNFVVNNLDNKKIIYINEKDEEAKLRKLINRFYSIIKEKEFISSQLNDNIISKYIGQDLVYIIHGSEEFVEKTNYILEKNNIDSVIINCYDVYDVKEKISKIIEKHDYYINTTGTVGKDFTKDKYFKKIDINKRSV